MTNYISMCVVPFLFFSFMILFCDACVDCSPILPPNTCCNGPSKQTTPCRGCKSIPNKHGCSSSECKPSQPKGPCSTDQDCKTPCSGTRCEPGPNKAHCSGPKCKPSQAKPPCTQGNSCKQSPSCRPGTYCQVDVGTTNNKDMQTEVRNKREINVRSLYGEMSNADLGSDILVGPPGIPPGINRFQ